MKLKKILSLFLICLFASSFFQSTVFAWQSNGSDVTMDTHKMIVEQAVSILSKDLATTESKNMKENLNLLKNNLGELKKGAVAPDYSEVGIFRSFHFSQDHFFNPTTGKNFTYAPYIPFEPVDVTAETQLRNYISQSLALWKAKDYKTASFYLGMAMHFFSDLTQPQHAANFIGLDHSKFEHYADNIFTEFKLSSLGYTTNNGEYLASTAKYPFITDFLTDYAIEKGKLSLALSPLVTKADVNNNWYKAAKDGLKISQTGATVIIYRYLKELSGESLKKQTRNFKKAFLVLTTSDEQLAGTLDNVYFEVETSSGQKSEFLCKQPCYNFKRGSKTSYEIDLSSLSISSLKNIKMSLKKDNQYKDNLKISSMEIYIDGICYFSKKLNTWINDAVTFKL